MAAPKTLEVRAQKEAMRRARREAEQRREQGQVAAQFITGLARDIYARTVLFPSDGSVEEKLEFYTKQAHLAMDAAIAFVRASNNYDDRNNIAKDAPPIVKEPTDANGSPVTLEG